MFVIIANRLQSGFIAFRDRSGNWDADIGTAAVYAKDAELDQALAAALIDVTERIVLDPQAIDVEVIGQRPVPVKLRERIRAAGPTTAYAVPAVEFQSESRFDRSKAA
jgi:hypothetical protein